MMRITAITVNAAGMAAERGIQGTRPAGAGQRQPENHAFGAECKVTISQEGKELSRQRQQAAQTEKSAQSVNAERMMRRGQEEAERDNSLKEEYRDKLDEIDGKINTLNSSYSKKKDRDETIGKQQEVLRAMRNLKEFQDEQSQRLEKEARQAAMQSAGYQNEIDENNRDLLTLLRSMEEAENAEKEREGGGEAESGNGGGHAAFGTANSTSDVIQNSAAHYGISSAEREWGVQEAIADLGEEGRQRLELADAITQSVLDTTRNIRASMDDELYTDEQIADMMKLLLDGTTKPGLAEDFRRRGWKIGMELTYDDVEYARGWGLQNLQDAQEVKIQQLGDSTARNVQQTKNSMMLSAADAILGEARQSGLDKASRELEEEVEKLADGRNDADNIRKDREQDEEEQEKKAEKKEEQAQRQEKLPQAEGRVRGIRNMEAGNTLAGRQEEFLGIKKAMEDAYKKLGYKGDELRERTESFYEVFCRTNPFRGEAQQITAEAPTEEELAAMNEKARQSKEHLDRILENLTPVDLAKVTPLTFAYAAALPDMPENASLG